MQTGDVVLKLTVRTLDEADAFASFLGRFLDSCCEAVERLAASAEPPFVMVSTEPVGELALKTVVFRDTALAAAFSQGWSLARGGVQALLPL